MIFLSISICKTARYASFLYVGLDIDVTILIFFRRHSSRCRIVYRIVYVALYDRCLVGKSGRYMHNNAGMFCWCRCFRSAALARGLNPFNSWVLGMVGTDRDSTIDS